MEELNELRAKLTWYENRNKQLESELYEIRDFIENAATPLHWVNDRGIIIWANQAELDSLGFAKEEYVGHSIRNFHADAHSIEEILTKLGNDEVLHNYPARLKCKDGSIKHVLISSNVFRKDGRFIHTRCFTRDITDIVQQGHRKDELLEKLEESQSRLFRSEKLFKSIALNIPNTLIIVIDKEHKFMAIEGDLMKKMGFDSQDYTGKHPAELTPEKYEITKYLYERVMAGEKFSIERKSSAGEDYMVHFVPLKNEQNEVESGLIIATDITSIKEAEEKSAKLAAIIESTDDAIISKTLEGIITSWNISAERTFGYTAEEMIGQPILKLIPSDRQDEEPRILSRLKSGERVEHFETRRLKKDGNLLDVSLTISPVKDTSGNIIGLSKIARDITERKQEEQRKNDFVAMVSHELKTPLTSVTSYVQLVLGRLKKEGHEFGVNALSRADLQAKKMSLMIHDFLNLTRIEDGKIDMNKQEFGLHLLIEEIADDAQFISTKHEVKLLGCEHIFVYGDKDKIGQVLTNLLSNAIKYSPYGGIIILGCQKSDTSVRIYVQDKGIGISRADQKRLFERFYRVKNEKIKSISGFGIGLYLVAEILRYHNSEIRVESEEGKGSTFYFNMDTIIKVSQKSI